MIPKKVTIDPDDAIAYGINAAIVLSLIREYIDNDYLAFHYANGRNWLVISADNMQSAIPYLTLPKIRVAIDILKANKAILVECHNTDPTDTTKWYTTVVD